MCVYLLHCYCTITALTTITTTTTTNNAVCRQSYTVIAACAGSIYYNISILPRCRVFFRSLTVTIMVWWSTTVDDSEMCNCTSRVYTCSSVYTCTINTTNTIIYFLIFAPLRTRNQYALTSNNITYHAIYIMHSTADFWIEKTAFDSV